MAKPSQKNVVQHILEKRSRHHQEFSDGIDYEITTRLETLKKSLLGLGSEAADKELFRHFPVATIACLETYFRSSISSIINSGGEYLERGLELGSEKTSALSFLPHLESKTVTLGDLISINLPFSSISHLETPLSHLLGQKLKQLARIAGNPYWERQQLEDKPPIIGDRIDEVWRGVEKGFKFRHIIAHESASKFEIGFDAALEILDSTSLMVEAINSIIWATAWKDRPLTQYELNMAAWDDYLSSKKRMAKLIRKIRSIQSPDRRRTFSKLHLKWKSLTREWCEFNTSPFIGGSIRPMLINSYWHEATVYRIGEIEGMTDLWGG